MEPKLRLKLRSFEATSTAPPSPRSSPLVRSSALVPLLLLFALFTLFGGINVVALAFTVGFGTAPPFPPALLVFGALLVFNFGAILPTSDAIIDKFRCTLVFFFSH